MIPADTRGTVTHMRIRKEPTLRDLAVAARNSMESLDGNSKAIEKHALLLLEFSGFTLSDRDRRTVRQLVENRMGED